MPREWIAERLALRSAVSVAPHILFPVILTFVPLPFNLFDGQVIKVDGHIRFGV